MNNLPLDIESERCQDNACLDNVEKVDHPANRIDWNMPGSFQGYQVYRCTECGDYWGCREQWDSGTGSDDRWHRFGPSKDFKRHY